MAQTMKDILNRMLNHEELSQRCQYSSDHTSSEPLVCNVSTSLVFLSATSSDELITICFVCKYRNFFPNFQILMKKVTDNHRESSKVGKWT